MNTSIGTADVTLSFDDTDAMDSDSTFLQKTADMFTNGWIKLGALAKISYDLDTHKLPEMQLIATRRMHREAEEAVIAILGELSSTLKQQLSEIDARATENKSHVKRTQYGASSKAKKSLDDSPESSQFRARAFELNTMLDLLRLLAFYVSLYDDLYIKDAEGMKIDAPVVVVKLSELLKEELKGQPLPWLNNMLNDVKEIDTALKLLLADLKPKLDKYEAPTMLKPNPEIRFDSLAQSAADALAGVQTLLEKFNPKMAGLKPIEYHPTLRERATRNLQYILMKIFAKVSKYAQSRIQECQEKDTKAVQRIYQLAFSGSSSSAPTFEQTLASLDRSEPVLDSLPQASSLTGPAATAREVAIPLLKDYSQRKQRHDKVWTQMNSLLQTSLKEGQTFAIDDGAMKMERVRYQKLQEMLKKPQSSKKAGCCIIS
eukprot:GILK01001602.1.p1 GENE.GILK01001602.1~~GILK01001602.1.p1  ORF type:complete len:458 (-),score=91.29 GILK01001602.1:207-1499(-)